MKRYFKYRYQDGGENYPNLLMMPNNRSGDLRTNFGLNDQKVLDQYELAALAKEKAKRDAEAEKLRQLVEAEAKRRAAVEKEKQRNNMAVAMRNNIARGDIPANYNLPTREDAQRKVEVARLQRDTMQRNLERLGYNEHTSRLFADRGWDKLLESTKKQLNEQSEDDYLIKNHPDYDPNIPIEKQKSLKYAESLRSGLLRQRNKLVNGDNPIMNLVMGALTAPAKSFINLTMDADNQYFKPGAVQGIANLGNDLMTVFPTATNQVAGKIVSGWNAINPAGIGQASLENIFQNRALQPIVKAAESEGVLSQPSPMGKLFQNRTFQPATMSTEGEGFLLEPLPFKNADLEYVPTQVSKSFENSTRKAAMDYGNLVKDPRYLERVKALDKELGLNNELQKRRELFLQQMDEAKATDMPFNIKFGKLSPFDSGLSKVKEELLDAKMTSDASILNLLKMAQTGKYTNYDYFTPWEREIIVSPGTQVSKLNPENVVPHELKHHWTNGLIDDQGGVQKYAEWLGKGTIDESKAALKGISPEAYKYHLNPTEIDAYLMTNLRKDLVEQGYMENPFSELSKDKLTDFVKKNKDNFTVQKYFKSGKTLVEDKDKFLNIFNKALPAVVPATAIGLNAASDAPGDEAESPAVNNEHYEQGGISRDGYKANSPDRFNPYNIIPSNNITMKNVRHPVLGIDNTGATKLMHPGYDYLYPGAVVLELPFKRFGGKYTRPCLHCGDLPRAQKGGSVVDYLSLSGVDPSFKNRKDLFNNYFNDIYKGTAEQNTLLLNALESERNESAAAPTLPPQYVTAPLPKMISKKAESVGPFFSNANTNTAYTPLFRTDADRDSYRQRLTAEAEKALGPEDDKNYLSFTSYHPEPNGYDCINGVCGLDLRAGLHFSNPTDGDRYLSNVRFAKNIQEGKEDYYQVNGNFQVGDHFQYLTQEGNPHHSMKLYKIDKDDKNNPIKYHFIHNGGDTMFKESEYSADDLKKSVTSTKDLPPDMIAWRPGKTVDKERLAKEHLRGNFPYDEGEEKVEKYFGDTFLPTFFSLKPDESGIDANSPLYYFSGKNMLDKTKNELLELMNNKELDRTLREKLHISDGTLQNLKPVIFGIAGVESNFGQVGTGRAMKERVAEAVTSDPSVGLFQIRLSSISDKAKEAFGISKLDDLKDTKKAYMAAVDRMLEGKRVTDAMIEKGYHPELANADPYFRATYYYNQPQKVLKSDEEWAKENYKDPTPIPMRRWRQSSEEELDAAYNDFLSKSRLRGDEGSYMYKVQQAAYPLSMQVLDDEAPTDDSQIAALPEVLVENTRKRVPAPTRNVLPGNTAAPIADLARYRQANGAVQPPPQFQIGGWKLGPDGVTLVPNIQLSPDATPSWLAPVKSVYDKLTPNPFPGLSLRNISDGVGASAANPLGSIYDRLKPNPFPGISPRKLPVSVGPSAADYTAYNALNPKGENKGKTYNLPGIKKTTYGPNVPLAAGITAGLSFLSNALEAKDRNKYDEWDRLMGMGDNLGVVTPGSRGDYTVNEGIFRPDRYVPVQFGAIPVAQSGGFFSDPVSAPLLETPPELFAYAGNMAGANNTGVPVSDGVAMRDDIVSNEKVNPNEAAREAYNYYVNEKSLAPHVAAGIVGNLYQESGVQPDSRQHGGGPGRGVAQWTAGKGKKDRWDHFITWSKKKERDPYDLYAQLDYVLEEPGEGSKALKALMKTRTPEEASYIFGKTYERPSEKYAAWNVRASIARKLYDENQPSVNNGMEEEEDNQNLFREGGEYAKNTSPDKPDMRRTLTPVDRSMANIEAERGETVWGDFDEDGIDEHLEVGGKPHYNGGTPLLVPEGSFVFSNTKRLKIGGPLLQEFGKSATTKKKFTPAELAKQYNVNKYKALLKQDNLDKIERDSAALMLDNYQRKLGKLALLQEGMKGFPQGIPSMAVPLLQDMGMNDESFPEAPLQDVAQNNEPFAAASLQNAGQDNRMFAQAPQEQLPQAQDGMVLRRTYPEPFRDSILRLQPGMKIIRRTAPPAPEEEALLSGVPIATNATLPGTTIPVYGGDVNDPRTYQRGTLNLGKGFNKYNAPWLQDYGYGNTNEGLTKAMVDAGYKGDVNDVKGVQQFLIQQNLDKGNLGLFDDLVKSYGMTNQGIKGGFKEGEYAFGDLDKMRDDPKLYGMLEKAFADGKFGVRSGEMLKSLLRRKMVPARLPIPEVDLSIGRPAFSNFTLPKIPVAEEKKPWAVAGKDKMPWWTQDVINTGALLGDRYNIRKYMPTYVAPGAVLPNGVFYDPTRALAVGQEAAASQSMMNALYAGPQRLRSNGSQIQGQLAGHVANTLGDYDNRNVAQATALEAAKAQVLTGLSAQKAGAYDNFLQRQAIANQQFDNSKRLASNDARLSLLNGMTNAQRTYWLNRLNPQYNINPSTGYLAFKGGKGIRNSVSGASRSNDPFALYKNSFDQFNAMFPGADSQRAYSFAEKMAFANKGRYDGDDEMTPQELAMLQGYGPQYLQGRSGG